MKKSFQFALVALATMASSSVFAGTYDQVSPFKHFYVGGGAGYAKYSVKDDTSSALRDHGLVLNADTGYRLNKYVGMQAEYYYLPTLKLDATGANSKLKSQAVALEAHLMMPINNSFMVFADGGYAAVFVRGNSSDGIKGLSETDYEPVASAGVEYQVVPNVAINVKYTGLYKATHRFETVNMGIAGLNFYF